MTNPLKQPYSFLISLRKTLKNAAVVLLPYLAVVEYGQLPGEWGLAVSLLAYWLKNFVENWK